MGIEGVDVVVCVGFVNTMGVVFVGDMVVFVVVIGVVCVLMGVLVVDFGVMVFVSGVVVVVDVRVVGILAVCVGSVIDVVLVVKFVVAMCFVKGPRVVVVVTAGTIVERVAAVVGGNDVAFANWDFAVNVKIIGSVIFVVVVV